jgi:hypothetical protein
MLADLTSDAGLSPITVAIFLAAVAAAYGLSFVLVKNTRVGIRFLNIKLPSLGADAALSLPAPRKGFSSSLSAQLWCELRQGGIILPVSTFVIWVIMILLALVVSVTGRRISPNDVYDWVFRTGLAFEVLPFVALVIATYIWVLVVARRQGQTGRPGHFFRRIPLAKDEWALARTLATAINMLFTVALLTVISTVSLLLMGHGEMAHMFGRVLAHGEASIREIAAVVLGFPMLAALLAWSLLGFARIFDAQNVWKTMKELTVIGALIALGGLTFDSWELAVMLAAFAPVILLLWKSVQVWEYGLVPVRTLAVCMLVWALVSAFIYPFGVRVAELSTGVMVMVSIAFGALATAPYVGEVLALAKCATDLTLAPENDERFRAKHGRRRYVVAMTVAVVMVAFAAWIRWPAEPVWMGKARAQGLPTTPAELNQWYAPVAPDENIALRYFDISRRLVIAGGEWNKREENLLRGNTPEKEWHRDWYDNDRHPYSHLLYLGTRNVPPGDPIPADVWKWTTKFWNAIGASYAGELHEAAQSGLTKSRYPINFEAPQGPAFEHLAPLRHLARLGMLGAVLEAVNKQPDAAVQILSDLVPLGGSLKEEPTMISQLVRFAIIDIAISGAREIINRVELSPENLEQLQQAMSRLLPPLKEGAVMDRAMVGAEIETMKNVSLEEAMTRDDKYYNYGSVSRDNIALASTLMPAISLSGFDFANQIVVLDAFITRAREENGDIIAGGAASFSGKSRYPQGVLVVERKDTYLSLHAEVRAPLAYAAIPALRYAYEAEWNARMRIETIKTAIAIERFRGAQSRLPQKLDDLVPAYLNHVPQDLYNNGLPLSYRFGPKGGYIVYSFGPNQRDDNGIVKPNYRLQGDIATKVCPPEMRDRPQVSTVDSKPK